MRLLNMKRMKTENNALFIESWSRTLFTEVVQSDTPEKPAKLRRIFRSNCLRPKHAQSHYCGLAFCRQNLRV